MMVLILLLGGCASSLQMSPEEIAQLDSDEGIVVGSIRASVLGFHHFTLSTREPDCYDFLCTDYYLTFDPTFGEQVFVTKLPVGTYGFRWDASASGGACADWEGSAGVNFTVRPGKVLYIGSLILLMPPAGKGPEEQLRWERRYSIEVEDRRDEVLASAATTHGSLLAKASTELMTPRARIFRATLPQGC